MRSFSILVIASLTAYASACLYPRDSTAAYSYDKETGPVVWHTLDVPNNKLCATGKNQSPINVVPGANVDVAGALAFNWPIISGDFDVINTGKTVQFTPKDSSNFKSTLNGKEYTLLQFHFHTPSEHRFKDEHFPLEVHFVHQDAEEQLAVVGVFFEVSPILGGDFLFSLNSGLNAVAASGATATTRGLLFGSVKDAVSTSTAYTYAGSLTTPPCKEGVTWFVAEKTLPISPAQYNRWKDIVKFNSRNTQNWPGHENLIVLAAQGLAALSDDE